MQTAHAAEVRMFADLARSFCSWCEGDALGDNAESLAAGWLARLYAAALLLPQVGPENEEDFPELLGEEVSRAKHNLLAFAGWYYRECFDPDPTLDDAPVMGDVGDDLLDTYKDIKRGLLLFDSGAVNAALWHRAFLHRMHWGRHAVGAMFALHCMHVSKRQKEDQTNK